MLAFGLNMIRLLKAVGRSWDLPAFRSALALAFLILLSGTLFYRSVEGWTWIDALYFSATTVSTVGYGDLAPVTDSGKLFTIIYMFVGDRRLCPAFYAIGQGHAEAGRPRP